MILGEAFVPGLGWRSLGSTLLAYALAARIPVLVVIFFAFRGNGGAGWGTHYDSVPARLASAGFGRKFVSEGLLPQMCLWIAYTVIVGRFSAASSRRLHIAGRRSNRLSRWHHNAPAARFTAITRSARQIHGAPRCALGASAHLSPW